MKPLLAQLLSIDHWTWRTVVAVLMVLVAYLVPRICYADKETTDVLEHLNLIALAMLSAELKQSTKPPNEPQ